jgi:hypothetical protein
LLSTLHCRFDFDGDIFQLVNHDGDVTEKIVGATEGVIQLIDT